MSGAVLRLPALLLLAGLLACAPGASARADEEAGAAIAWFPSLAEARAAAVETGRPIFVALHVRPHVASPAATERTRRWLAAYADPEFVALSRELACVLRVNTAAPGQDPDVDEGAPAAMHVVIDGDSRVLARLDADVPPMPGVLARLLRRGLRVHGDIPADAPRLDPRRVARRARPVEGISPMQPVGLPTDAPGVRLRLRWGLPVPALGGAGDAPDRVSARILLHWDDAGPFEVGRLEASAGELLDVPVDVRFDAFPALAPLVVPGLHRVDLWLEPLPGSFPFSRGPLHVGRVWIELGDGGGGGGDGQQPEDQPQPEPEDEEQPAPAPEGEPPEPPIPPEQAQDDVIEPFVGEGEAVKKEDAVVAVEDDDAGLEKPAPVPLAEALRDFEKLREAAVDGEGIEPGERAFLRRYFDLLRKHARPAAGSPGAGGKAPR